MGEFYTPGELAIVTRMSENHKFFTKEEIEDIKKIGIKKFYLKKHNIRFRPIVDQERSHKPVTREKK